LWVALKTVSQVKQKPRASKAKQGIHSLLAIGRQVFRPVQESMASSCYLGRQNTITPNIPPSFFPQHFIAEHKVMWHGISFWSVRVSGPGCVPSQLLVPPQATCWWGGVRSIKGLDIV